MENLAQKAAKARRARKIEQLKREGFAIFEKLSHGPDSFGLVARTPSGAVEHYEFNSKY